MRGLILGLLAYALAACVAAPAPRDTEGIGDPGAAAEPGTAALPPAGLGTLREDEFSVEIESGAVTLRATPLEEWIIRLAAPDTYQRLARIARTYRPDMPRDDVTLFLVSFFSTEPGAPFQPTNLVLESSGREFRPERIIPLTPGWGEQRLQQERPELAVFVYDGALHLNESLALRYGSAVSERWQDILSVIYAERSRVAGRAESRIP